MCSAFIVSLTTTQRHIIQPCFEYKAMNFMYLYQLPPSSLTPSLMEYFADLFSCYLTIKTHEITGIFILIEKQKIHQEKS